MDVIALDKVQKNRPIDGELSRGLKSRKLIEGRRPNLFATAKVAAVTEDKASYIKGERSTSSTSGMVAAYLEKLVRATRTELDDLLLGKLSDALDEKQLRAFVTNPLQEMKKAGQISHAEWRDSVGKWRIRPPEHRRSR